MAYMNTIERLAIEQGVQQGVQQGMQEGALKQAIKMIRDFNLPIAKVAEKYKLSMDELVRRLNQDDLSKH